MIIMKCFQVCSIGTETEIKSSCAPSSLCVSGSPLSTSATVCYEGEGKNFYKRYLMFIQKNTLSSIKKYFVRLAIFCYIIEVWLLKSYSYIINSCLNQLAYLHFYNQILFFLCKFKHVFMCSGILVVQLEWRGKTFFGTLLSQDKCDR